MAKTGIEVFKTLYLPKIPKSISSLCFSLILKSSLEIKSSIWAFSSSPKPIIYLSLKIKIGVPNWSFGIFNLVMFWNNKANEFLFFKLW